MTNEPTPADWTADLSYGQRMALSDAAAIINAAPGSTIADVSHHQPWCCHLDRLCTYCASPGREGRPLDAPDAPDGHCIACGDPLDPGHCPTSDCRHDATATCEICPGPDVSAEHGCWNCHGTGRPTTEPAEQDHDRAGHPLPCSCNAGHDLDWEN